MRSSPITPAIVARSFLLLSSAIPALAWGQQQAPNLFPKSALETPSPARVDAPRPVPIDAAWRAVEHAAFDQFRPDAATVSDGNPLGQLGRQLARPAPPIAPAPPERGRDDSRLSAPSTPSATAQAAEHREAQIERAQQAWEEPAAWMVTLVEVRVADDGTPAQVAVTRSSGRAKLDRAARDAVEGALRGARLVGPAIARFRVEAGVSVAMPARAVVEPTRQRANGVMVRVASGTFGGNRPTEVTAPLQPRVRTRVTLVEVLR